MISLRYDGSQPDSAIFGATAWGPAITPDGRYVAFSFDDWLTPEDQGPESGYDDIYVRDRRTGAVDLVSKGIDGGAGNYSSQTPAISDDGRYVAFQSEASNLIEDDSNAVADVFVRDRTAGKTTLVSVSPDGIQGDAASGWTSISADGRFVAFTSIATNLVPSDDNSFADVFVRDLETGTTELVSVSSEEAQGLGLSYQPSISADGRYVAFTSGAENLVADDRNGETDVIVRDRVARTTERVSVASDGSEGHGRFLGPTVAPAGSYFPHISRTGRYVGFTSYAVNLVPSDTNASTDVFVHDRETGVTERVSVSSKGTETAPHPQDPQAGCFFCYGRTKADSYWGDVSSDGRYVTFLSEAANLVPGDTNNRIADTFVHDRLTGATERVSVSESGVEPKSQTSHYRPAITDDGRNVVFIDGGEGLGPPGTIQYHHVYLRKRGPDVGVGGLKAEDSAGQVAVSGWARFSAATLGAANDDQADGNASWRLLGGELTGASLISRPEEGDLQVRLRLATLPPKPVPEALAYVVQLRLDGQLHEYLCHATACSSGVNATFGTTGNEVWMQLPAPGAGTRIENVKVFAVQRNPGTNQWAEIDSVALTDGVMPEAFVMLGIAPHGTPESEVDFTTRASLQDGNFAGTLDVTALSGDVAAWARACLGDMCGSASAPVSR